ncbi:MAG: hypothetical protein Q8O17_06700, partial [Candidatus Methanoperedens sp.]|nr:hypothetical protein [Candidatus Methanoperedens sp.]
MQNIVSDIKSKINDIEQLNERHLKESENIAEIAKLFKESAPDETSKTSFAMTENMVTESIIRSKMDLITLKIVIDLFDYTTGRIETLGQTLTKLSTNEEIKT